MNALLPLCSADRLEERNRHFPSAASDFGWTRKFWPDVAGTTASGGPCGQMTTIRLPFFLAALILLFIYDHLCLLLFLFPSRSCYFHFSSGCHRPVLSVCFGGKWWSQPSQSCSSYVFPSIWMHFTSALSHLLCVHIKSIASLQSFCLWWCSWYIRQIWVTWTCRPLQFKRHTRSKDKALPTSRTKKPSIVYRWWCLSHRFLLL